MKFLVDNQLPLALARYLHGQGYETHHVMDIQLDEKPDAEIWDYAYQSGLIIVTKDEDFAQRTFGVGQKVQVVWVRLGNCRKDELLAHFEANLTTLIRYLKAGNMLIELY